jgi:DNA-binding XRE family transcriptional regulator
MVTKNDPTELLQSYPEEIQEFMLAVSVMSRRIASLPKADQSDLWDLLIARNRAEDDDERKAIAAAMIEIMTQAKVTVSRMPLPAAGQPPRGTEGWAKHVGRKIKELRTRAGLTQSQLAAKAELPQPHISRLENAEYSATHLTLTKIANALGVDVGDIDPCVD